MRQQRHTLYISDLDGTLLNEESRITPHTAHTLNTLIDEGMLFSIATARTPATVVELMKDVNIKLPVILMTGALVYDLTTHRYLSISSFPASTTARIIEAVQATGIAPMLYYIEDSLLHVSYHAPLTESQQLFINQRQGTPYKLYTEEPAGITPKPHTVLIFFMGEYEKMQAIYDIIAPIEGHCSYLYHDNTQPQLGYLEIYPAGTSKAQAIKQLAGELGVDELVVFGDNRNDIPMFEVAHRSYATANAVDEAKSHATGIIASNSEEGVATFLMDEYRKDTH